jgi:hypothetical protein
MEQVILNLAVNGMDAMQDCASGGSKISIQTALADESPAKPLLRIGVFDVRSVPGPTRLLGTPVRVGGNAVFLVLSDGTDVETPLADRSADFLGRAEAYDMASSAVEGAGVDLPLLRRQDRRFARSTVNLLDRRRDLDSGQFDQAAHRPASSFEP